MATKIHKISTESMIRQKLLDGQPFTYSSIVAWAQIEFGIREDETRLVDHEIQGLLARQQIQFDRLSMKYVPASIRLRRVLQAA